MPPKIVLIGPPGCGKSTVGRGLSHELTQSFSDTASMTEDREKSSISDIFTEQGEGYFRAIEEEVVAQALSTENGVLSLGGGAILSEVTQELLRNSGSEIVFLDVSITGAAPRIGFNRDRPLLIDNPRARWVALMAQRRHIYESLATHVINTDDKSPNETVDSLRKELSK
jgi:shikimate kinase